jgi:hypothetical protein
LNLVHFPCGREGAAGCGIERSSRPDLRTAVSPLAAKGPQVAHRIYRQALQFAEHVFGADKASTFNALRHPARATVH